MSEEKLCHIHNTPTRLSCASCGIPICAKCAVESAVGYKCKKCATPNLTHIQIAEPKKVVLGVLLSLIAGSIVAFIWMFLSLSFLFNIAFAYLVGFVISKTMTAVIGHKVGRKFQVIAGIIALICIIFNPVFIVLPILYGHPEKIFGIIAELSYITFNSILRAIFSVWAAVRHFKI